MARILGMIVIGTPRRRRRPRLTTTFLLKRVAEDETYGDDR